MMNKIKDNMKYLLSCLLLTGASVSMADTNQKGYVLDIGDSIEVRVYGEEDLSFKHLIADDSSLSYPFVGSISLVGKTTSQIQQEIYQGLLDGYLVKPEVSVSIESYRDFYITGQVKNPGAYEYEPGLTVNKAIAIAGGFTERASEDDILLSHADGSTNKSAKLSTAIKPGDSITIDRRFF
jgi:polysaccharide biosynthesis/export protein VpsN